MPSIPLRYSAPWPAPGGSRSSNGSAIPSRTSRPSATGTSSRTGFCVLFIADKLGVAQPTATGHLQALARAGLVTSKRVGQWTFYKRDEAAIRDFTRQLGDQL